MSLMGLVVGMAAGLAAGLLAAPMRGTDMRASLRSRADEAVDRGMMLFEEGRRAFSRGSASTTGTPVSADATERDHLTATLGEIANMHPGGDAATRGARS